MDSAPPETMILPYLIFGGFLSAGLFCGIQLIRLEALRIKKPPDRYLDLCCWLLFASIIGGRLAGMLVNAPFAPQRFFYFWNGGSFYLGGMPAAVAVGLIYLYKRRLPIWSTADIFAPALAAGYFFVRAGCFYSGFCSRYRLPTSPLDTLADRIIPLDVHQLFLATGGLLGFFALLKLRRQKRFAGQVFWMAVLFGGLLHSTADGLYDGATPVHGFNGPLIPVLVMLGAAGMLARLGSRTKDPLAEHRQGRHHRGGNRL